MSETILKPTDEPQPLDFDRAYAEYDDALVKGDVDRVFDIQAGPELRQSFNVEEHGGSWKQQFWQRGLYLAGQSPEEGGAELRRVAEQGSVQDIIRALVANPGALLKVVKDARNQEIFAGLLKDAALREPGARPDTAELESLYNELDAENTRNTQALEDAQKSAQEATQTIARLEQDIGRLQIDVTDSQINGAQLAGAKAELEALRGEVERMTEELERARLGNQTADAMQIDKQMSAAREQAKEPSDREKELEARLKQAEAEVVRLKAQGSAEASSEDPEARQQLQAELEQIDEAAHKYTIDHVSATPYFRESDTRLLLGLAAQHRVELVNIFGPSSTIRDRLNPNVATVLDGSKSVVARKEALDQLKSQVESINAIKVT